MLFRSSNTHNYDQVIELYKFGKNNYCKLSSSFGEYAEKYPIKNINYQINDPTYSDHMIALENSIDRFLHYKNKI